VPRVIGLPVAEAESVLGGAGFEVARSELDPQAFPGEPGKVLRQIPQDWAEPGAGVVIGYLKDVEPEPEEEPEEAEPEEVEPEAPEPEGGVPPVAVAGGGAEGPWVGQLHLAALTVDGSATTTDRLFNRLLDWLVDEFKREKEEKEREEQERQQARQDGMTAGEALGELADIPGAIGEGIGDAIGKAIAMIALPYGKAGLDILNEGVDVSFALQQEAAGYRIVIPGMPADKAEKADKHAKLLTTTDGHTFSAEEVLDPNSGARVSLSIVMNEDYSSASLELTASGRNPNPKSPQEIRSGSITLTGEFQPGQMTYQEIEANIKRRIEPLVERAMVKVVSRLKPYLETE
jgi:hypothetical protein